MSTASQNKLKASLLVSLGREGCEILNGLPDPKTASMIVAIDLMNTFAANHLPYLSENIFSARQEQNESANAFACRLRRLWLQTMAHPIT